MPRRAPTPCRYPGCAQVLNEPGYCDTHGGLVHRDYGRARRRFDAEVDFYRSTTWRQTRSAFLLENPLCVACLGHERYVPATVVDHIVPIKDGGDRFERCNLQPLCVSCHNRKTARESAQKRRTGGGSFF